MQFNAITKKLDQLYEFDREPIPEDKLQGIGNFLGIYGGEHIAATGFVTGMLWIVHGVSAKELFIGAFIGNLLAVMSWTFITAPIATKARLSLYWQLRKICGPSLVSIYNLVNGLMFCILAGAMIAVSATAIGIPFNIDMPGLNDLYPHSIGWVVTVFFVGSGITLIAILGFKSLGNFGKVVVPWLFLVFIAAAVSSFSKVGIAPGLKNFWEVANNTIWTGVAKEGRLQFNIWHVIFFTWMANAAMHLGMSDLTILRYAKKWHYGLASALGMYGGHYIVWIASGIVFAAAISDAPGTVAYEAIGITGAITVIIAGWSTANPTLYRAGLALQGISPNWQRWKVTLIAGLIATFAAMFPALVMRLLDFVALYGLILIPIGGIIIADFYLIKSLGMQRYFAEKNGISFNAAAGITWLILLVLALIANLVLKVNLFFLAAPTWLAAILLYLVLSLFYQKRIIKNRQGMQCINTNKLIKNESITK